MQVTHAYDVVAMQNDMADRGWLPADLAHRARVSHMTIARFFDRKHQTPRTAKKISAALGKAPGYYRIRVNQTAEAS